jgi:hypothetical protein
MNRLTAVYSVVFMIALTLSAYSRSLEIPITPNHLEARRFVFTVSTKDTKDGVAFHVTITAKVGEIPSDIGVGFVTFIQHKDGSEEMGPRTDIPLTVKKEKQVWTVDFVLSPALLKENDYLFLVSETYPEYEAADMYEIKPQDFLKK